MPALFIGTRVLPLVHAKAQIAAALGLPVPKELGSPRLVWEIAALQEAWLEAIASVDGSALTTVKPLAGRTTGWMIAHCFNALDETIAACSTGIMSWRGPATPAAETAIVERLVDRAAAVAYIEERIAAWRSFAFEIGDESADTGRTIEHRGGPVTFRQLLASQRQHLAGHLRHTTYAFDVAGFGHAGRDPHEIVADLELPPFVDVLDWAPAPGLDVV